MKQNPKSSTTTLAKSSMKKAKTEISIQVAQINTENKNWAEKQVQ